MQLVQRRLSLAVLLALIFAALPSARPTYALNATIFVENTSDTDNGGTNDCGSDACSLREAIRLANNRSGADTINFRGAGIGKIILSTALPPLTGVYSTTIDAGTSHNVIIDGAVLAVNGLKITSSDNTVRGLVFNNLGTGTINYTSLAAIMISGGSGNQIYGNWIGVEVPLSLVTIPNDGYGIYIGDGASNNIIGADTIADRNVIGANLAGGVYLYNATSSPQNQNNRIVGNYIGLNDAGVRPTYVNTEKATAGVIVSDGSLDTTISNNVIGGFTSIITGAIAAGIEVTGYMSNDANIPTNTTITGNYIGVSKTGVRLANHIGISLGGYSNFGPNNTIIGDDTDPSKRNVIAGNSVRGIDLPDNNTATWGDVRIAGNYIGLDGSGNPQGNGWGDAPYLMQQPEPPGQGIYIGFTNGFPKPIGKITIGPGNVISANTTFGVWLRTGGHVIKGNWFGTDATGTTSTIGGTANGNVNILLENGDDVTIGGPTVADRNIIAYSDNYQTTFSGGIQVNPLLGTANCSGSPCSSNRLRIQGNYIGVAPDGVTPLNSTYATTASTRKSIGINLQATSTNTITGNLIGGLYQGIVLGSSSTATTSAANNNLIFDNKIGAPANGEIFFPARPAASQIVAPRNLNEGILLYRGTGNTIRANLVAYNWMALVGSSFMPGIRVGLFNINNPALTHDSAYNNVVEDNRLVRNGEINAFGIVVQNSTSVRLSRNTTQFHESTKATGANNGIYLAPTSGNANLAAPTLSPLTAPPLHVTGSTSPGCSGCTVELFTTGSDTQANAREGPVYLTHGTTSPDGSFSIPVTVCQQFILATVTDTFSNTSPFSTKLDTVGSCAPPTFTLDADSGGGFRTVVPGSTTTYTHTLHNTSLVPLEFTVVLTSSNKWASVTPTRVSLSAVGSTGDSMDVVVSVSVPVTATSALTETTNVQAFLGLQGSEVRTDTTTIGSIKPATPSVDGPNPQIKPWAASSVTFAHMVRNTGDVAGSFVVSTPTFVGTHAGWGITSVTPTTISSLAAHTATSLGIVVSTPSTLPPAGTPITISFDVSDSVSPLLSVNQTDVITIPVVHSLSFTPRSSEVLTTTTAGGNLTFTYALTNTGNATDSFTVTAGATSPTATSTIASTVTSTPPSLTNLAPGATAVVTVTYGVPVLTTADVGAYTANIKAQAADGTAQTRPVTLTVEPIRRSLSFTLTSEVSTVPAGAKASFTYILTNTGNANDTFSIGATAAISSTAAVTSTPALDRIGPNATAAVTVTYRVPSGTAAGVYTATITAQSADSAIPPTPVTSTVTISVTGGGAVQVTPGQPSVALVLPTVPVTVTFTNLVTNTGNVSVPIVLALSTLPVSWTASILPDLVLTTCPISPTLLPFGTDCFFTVEVVVPAGAPPGPLDLMVTATPFNTFPVLSIPDTALNRVNVGTVRSLVLAPTGLTDTGGPAQVVTFTHTLTNTGNAPDSFDLVVNQSDGRWTTTVSPTTVISLPAGLAYTVEVTAVAGVGILGGTTNVITLTATGQGGGPSQSVTDTLTMRSISAGMLSPGGRNNVDAGQVVTSTFTVTNTGTAPISYTVRLQNSAADWSATAGGVPTVVLLPGLTATFTVSVTAPINAALGVTNTTTVQLLIGDGTGAPLDSATLDTSIGPRFGVMLTPTDRSAEGMPGSTMVFTHTLTNIGSEPSEFRLFTADDLGWPVSITPDQVILDVGESVQVMVRVRIQNNARAGDQNVVAAKVELVGNPSINAQALEHLTVAHVAGINLSSSQARRVQPGETVNLNSLSLTNLGSYYDTFNLTVTGADNGWGVVLGQTTVSVDKGNPAAVSVQVKVPTTVVSGDVKVLRIEARSTGDATVSQIVLLSFVYVAPPVPPKQKVYLPLVQR